jgi:hypothetical protein
VPLDHGSPEYATGAEGTGHVGFQDRIPVRLWKLKCGHPFGAAGTVHEDLDTSECITNKLRETLEAGVVGDIACRGERPPSQGLDRRNRGAHLFRATPRGHHIRCRVGPGNFAPSLSQIRLTVSGHTARATRGRLAPSAEIIGFLLLPVDPCRSRLGDPPPSLHENYPVSSLSGRRRRAYALTTVRRSNCTYGFPVAAFTKTQPRRYGSVPRFSNVPVLETVLIDGKDIPSAGAGESSLVGVAPAIATAIFRCDRCASAFVATGSEWPEDRLTSAI